MSKLICTVIPILPGKTGEWRSFVSELKGSKKEQFTASRKSLNVHERTFYQRTPMGDIVIVTLEGEDPEKSFQSFGASQDEFSRWFVEKVKAIHGIDLAHPAAEAMPELVVDSSD